MWRSFVREYLRFTRKERNGILALVALVLLTSYAPHFLFYFERVPVAGSSGFKAAVDTFEAALAAANKAPDTAGAVPPPASLFYFDPNTLTAAGWQQLGVSGRTAASIGKYLAKGGRFREAADLQKIYNLPPALCARLQPYVRIPAGSKAYKREPSNDNASFTRYRKKAPPSLIDINAADTLAWQSLPGIGPGFARRIVAFRNRLGGFYEVAQVSECYGLPDSVFQKIQPFLQIGNSSLIKLDLNLTDEKSLAAHPYIRYKLAHLIVQYRSIHGGFRAVSELRRLPLVDEIIYRKIEHYIELKQ
jgi:DNA uptake protein ComE-like DNA-binding protein